MAKSLDSEEHERRMSEQADAEIDTLREVNAALVEALEALNSPTSWFDVDRHYCRYCGASNPGWIEHTADCEVTKATAALRLAHEAN